MKIKLYNSVLKGTVSLPSSKSYTHRALICSSLCQGTSIINEPLFCDDTLSTIKLLRNLGVNITYTFNQIIVKSSGRWQIKGRLDCEDSATTLRMIIPVLSFFSDAFTIECSERLCERIKTEEIKDLAGLQITVAKDRVFVKGKVKNKISITHRLTSQWSSGALLLLPLSKGSLKTSQVGNPYLQMTMAMMKQFGVDVISSTEGLVCNNEYTQAQVTIEPDFSNGSFFLNMKELNRIKITNLKIAKTEQGDYEYQNMLKKYKGNEKEITFNMGKYPDLVIPLAFLASIKNNKKTVISGLEKLKYKESNRITSIVKTLKTLGAHIIYFNNTLYIEGQKSLPGGKSIDSFNDHRIIMGVVSIMKRIKEPIIIENCEAVSKSFPEFFRIYALIGGKYDFIVS